MPHVDHFQIHDYMTDAGDAQNYKSRLMTLPTPVSDVACDFE